MRYVYLFSFVLQDVCILRARYMDPGIIPYTKDENELQFTYLDEGIETVERIAAFKEVKCRDMWLKESFCGRSQFGDLSFYYWYDIIRRDVRPLSASPCFTLQVL